MDSARGYDDLRQDVDPTEGGVGEPVVKIAVDERRMHVRAYNHWVSLLDERPFPAIGDLRPESIADFGPNSVLLDFTQGEENPTIQFIGRALRDECAVDQSITRIAEVPARSLLSRLTDRYQQILADRAPVGFEAEFIGTRGHNTLYRGILLPFSSDGGSIDYVYGIISWKELVTAEAQAALDAELAAAVRLPRHDPVPGWADGPSSDGAAVDMDAPETLDDRLASARESAASARAAAARSHAALYRALGRAHDFALAAAAAPERFAAMLAEADITPQARAPMTAVAKLVFGRDYDKARLAEAAIVLAYAQRTGVAEGALARVLETVAGGIKGIVAQDRAARRATEQHVGTCSLVERAALAEVAIDSGLEEGAPVILIGRASANGIAVVGTIGDDAKLTEQLLRRLR